MQAPIRPQAPRLLLLEQVLHRTGLTDAQLRARIEAAAFPAPVNLGDAGIAWIEADVRRWIHECVAMRPMPAAA